MRDLYQVLGVARDAAPADIKKSYKKLAREFHPDRNQSPGAEERFKEITAAYEVLGDEERRPLYDEFGDISLRPGFNPARARAYAGGMGGAGFRNGGGGFGGMEGGINLDEIFGNLFRGRSRQAHRPPGPERGPNLRNELQIDLLMAIRGGEVALTMQRPSHCEVCQGEGGTERKSCPRCEGSGRVHMRQFGMDALVGCDHCGGSGSVFSDECSSCAGTGRSRSQVRLNVKIPAGVSDGQTIRLRGQGGEGRRGGRSGDLLLDIRVRPHKHLSRDGKDLELEVPITFAEALSGGRVQVPTPWGDVNVRVPPGAASGTRLRLKGKGVGGKGGPGDLYLVLRPTPPQVEGDVDPAVIEQLTALYGADPREELLLD